MTPKAFDALSSLLQVRQGLVRDAARLVLVGGVRPSEAALQTGLSRASVSNALTRYRKGLYLAQLVNEKSPR